MAFILNMLIIIGVMWAFFRYMYPKPPKEFFAKAGDDISLRACSHCGTPLATYRGILIPKSLPADTAESDITHPFTKDDDNVVLDECYFFCNTEHQADFVHKQKQSQSTTKNQAGQ